MSDDADEETLLVLTAATATIVVMSALECKKESRTQFCLVLAMVIRR